MDVADIKSGYLHLPIPNDKVPIHSWVNWKVAFGII